MAEALHVASGARGTTGCELKFSILVSCIELREAADFRQGPPGKCFIMVSLCRKRLFIMTPGIEGALTPLLLILKEDWHLQCPLNSRETS